VRGRDRSSYVKTQTPLLLPPSTTHLPVLRERRSALVPLRVSGILARGKKKKKKKRSDTSNQQTMNTGRGTTTRARKCQRVWLKYFKYPPLFLEWHFNLRDVYACLRASFLLFFGSIFPLSVCLLIEMVIEISEGDFNHRGVAHAYLSETTKEERVSSRRCHPSRSASPSPRQEGMCLETRLPFSRCNTCQNCSKTQQQPKEQTE